MERERGRRQELVKDLRAEARQLLDRLAWIGAQRRRLARRAFELGACLSKGVLLDRVRVS